MRPAGVGVVALLFVWSMTTHGKFSDSGDEPHYLIVAESLWADGDLDLANNFANGDTRWFAAESLESFPHARPNRFGALWSVHDIGVPVALLPVYVAATRLAAHVPESWLAPFRQTRGLFAYSVISLSLACLTALAAARLASAFGRLGPRGPLVALAVALTPPVLSMSFLIFPETLAFVIVVAVVGLAVVRDDEATTSRMVTVSLLLGALPWLHRKYALLAIALFAVLLAHRRAWWARASAGARAAVVAAALGPQAAFHVWTVIYWGGLGGPQMLGGVPLSLANVPRGALGLVADRGRGLLGGAPIYLLAPAAWLLAWRRAWLWLIPIACLYLPMAAYIDWPSGFAPAARYLSPIMPLVALPAVWAVESAAFRVALWPCLAWQLVMTAIAWQYPRGFWPTDDTSHGLLMRVPGVGPMLNRWMPSIATGDPVTLAVVWIGAAVLVGLIVRQADARQRGVADSLRS